VTELRAALHDNPRKLCEELYNRYIANPRTRRRAAYRDRGIARRTVTKALRARLPREAVEPHVKVPGRYEEHKFDLGLRTVAIRALVDLTLADQMAIPTSAITAPTGPNAVMMVAQSGPGTLVITMRGRVPMQAAITADSACFVRSSAGSW
jgi:hypothetical protein